ncbi:hypothetical protein [Virgibacillus sediminis]|uniref:Uncharacterized protein n=1 Tax=Virgibacillus sediminis TaxID=202260 RepID=A0ABV7A3B9_9BACI
MAGWRKGHRKANADQGKKREVAGLIILVFLLLLAGLIIGRLAFLEDEEENIEGWKVLQMEEAGRTGLF